MLCLWELLGVLVVVCLDEWFLFVFVFLLVFVLVYGNIVVMVFSVVCFLLVLEVC